MHALVHAHHNAVNVVIYCDNRGCGSTPIQAGFGVYTHTPEYMYATFEAVL
jgi:hypothetical protein